MAGAKDDGGSPAEGGSSEGLAGLPAEWGVIVIPDDLTELSTEVRAIRTELRRAARPCLIRRLLRRPKVKRVRQAIGKAIRTPVLIISIAVLMTVASLFASAWPSPTRPPLAQRTVGATGASATEENAAADSGTGKTTTDEGDALIGDLTKPTSLPALELASSTGQNVSLRGKLPAVILLIEGCACDQLVAGVLAAVRPQVAVVTIIGATAHAPAAGANPQAQGKTILMLHDPAGSVRSQLKVSAPNGSAAVLLVDSSATIVRKLLSTVSATEFSPDLARL